MADRDGIIAAMAATMDTINDATQGAAGTYFAPLLAGRIAGLEVTYPNHLTNPTQAAAYMTGAQVQLGAAVVEMFQANDWRAEFLGAIADGILLQGQALDPHAAVRVATTGNITLSGAQTIDGISAIAGDRVLVKNQTTGSQNGVYVVAAGAWSRATDMDATGEMVHGTFVAVLEGTANAGTSWIVTTLNPITLGTTATVWELYQGSLTLTAGDGLVRVGNAFNVGAGAGITVAADSISISASYAGQTSITTVGTIGAGTWQGTPVDPVYGGTGISSYALGDTLYGSGVNTLAKLAGNTTTTKKFLRQTGNGTISAAPAWDTLVDADLPGTLVRTSRVIATITPLQGGGALSGDLTLSVGGLVTLGGADQMVGVNAAASAWEYKTFAGTSNRLTVTATPGNYAWDISASYVGQTSITTLGTITTGVWNGTVIGLAYGGTGISSYVVGDMLYASGTATLSRLLGNTAATRKFLMGLGNGTTAAAPIWDTLLDADLPGTIVRTTRTISTTAPLTGGGDLSANRTLGLAGLTTLGTAHQVVSTNAGATAWEYKTFSGTSNRLTVTNGTGTMAFDIAATYAGQTSITTVGTITSGTWNGTVVGVAYGGTGLSTIAQGDILYGSASGVVSRLSSNAGASRQFLTSANSSAPAWATIAASDLPGSFSGFANPTASIGLVTVNGTATTAMRSDAAPALSQAIAPTWSAVHTFNPGTSPALALALGIAQPGSAGTRNSHVLQWTGTSFDTAGHSADWRTQVVMASNAGASSFELTSRVDAGAFATRFRVTDAGLVTLGTWQATTVAVAFGGTGLTTIAQGELLYGSAAGVIARLAGNAGATRQFLTSASGAAPVWDTLLAADLPGGFSGFANPTAQTGLTAINGTATTAMRSDAAPALNVSIAPTWTGAHTFNSGNTPLPLITFGMAQPGVSGTRDSHALQWTGTAFNTAGHSADWKAFVSMSSTAGASGFTLQSRIDSGTFTTRLQLSDAGVLSSVSWAGATIAPTFGGTGIAAYTLGDLLYASATNTLSRLAANSTAARQFLMSQSSGAPSWSALAAGDLPVGVAGATSALAKFTSASTVGASGLLSEASGLITLSGGSFETKASLASVPKLMAYTTDAPTVLGQTGGALLLGLQTRLAEIRSVVLTDFSTQTWTSNPRVGLAFYPYTQASGPVEAMRITDTLNLLVGTTADTGDRLRIVGTASLTGTLAADGNVFTTAAGNGFWIGTVGTFTYGMYQTGTQLAFRSGSVQPWLTVTSAGNPTFTTPVTMNNTLTVVGGATVGSLTISNTSPSIFGIYMPSTVNNFTSAGPSAMAISPTFTSTNSGAPATAYFQFRTSGAVYTTTVGRAIWIDSPSIGSTTVSTLIALDIGNQGSTNAAIRTGTGTVSFGGATTVNSSLTVTSTTTHGGTSTYTGSTGAAFSGGFFGYFIAPLTGNNQYVLGSTGFNYGVIGNSGTGLWYLGYSAAATTPGTAVLTWDASNSRVTTASDLFVGGNLVPAGGVRVGNFQGMFTVFSAGDIPLISRQGTVLNLGYTSDWTGMAFNVASGSYTFSIGGAAYNTFSTSGNQFRAPVSIGSVGPVASTFLQVSGTVIGQANATQYGIVSTPIFVSGAVNVIGMLSQVNLASGLSLSGAYALYLDTAVFGSSTAANEFGLYINGIVRGSNRYAIYTNEGVVNLGDVVRVRAQPSGGGGITGNATDRGYLALGASGGAQLQLDPDEIQAMSGISPVNLDINYTGGNLYFGRGSTTSTFMITGSTGYGNTTPLGRLDVRASDTESVIAAFGDHLNNTRIGFIYFSASNTINSGYGLNSDGEELWINYHGYQNAPIRSRNLSIGDGKEHRFAYFDGQTKRVTINGNAGVSGITADLQVNGVVWSNNGFYNNESYRFGYYNVEASSTAYFEARNGGTVNVRLAPDGHGSPLNYFRLPVAIGQNALITGVTKLDVRADGVTDVIAAFGCNTSLGIGDYPGFIYFSNINCIGFGYNRNSAQEGWINRFGYQNGTTQFRDLQIGDGKNSEFVRFEGASKSVIYYTYIGSVQTEYARFDSGAHALNLRSDALLYVAGTGQTQILINATGADYATIQNDSSNTWSLGYKVSSGPSLGTAALSWNTNRRITIPGELYHGSNYTYYGHDHYIKSDTDTHELFLCGGSDANIANGAYIQLVGALRDTGPIGSIELYVKGGGVIGMRGITEFRNAIVLHDDSRYITTFSNGMNLDVTGRTRIILNGSSPSGGSLNLVNAVDGQQIVLWNNTAGAIGVNGTAGLIQVNRGVILTYDAPFGVWITCNASG